MEIEIIEIERSYIDMLKERDAIILNQRIKIAELEEDKAFLLTQRIMGNIIVKTSQELSNQIQILKLKQQANAIESAVNDCANNSGATMVYIDDLDCRVTELRDQAEAIRNKSDE